MQTEIAKIVDTELSKLKGDYGVVIKDLTSKVYYSKNQDREFTSASIYKLALMYKIFDLIEHKALAPDEEVSPNLTVQKALELMITVSDNNSALALAEKAGWGNIQTTLEQNGIPGFKLNQQTPTTTAEAISVLLEQIYNNQAVSLKASQKMKELLMGQQINDRIPKYLPVEVKVAHKTGELDFVRHDAAIVYGTKSDYIFVFLSQTPKPGEAAENIAKLSKTVYEQLEKNN